MAQRPYRGAARRIADRIPYRSFLFPFQPPGKCPAVPTEPSAHGASLYVNCGPIDMWTVLRNGCGWRPQVGVCHEVEQGRIVLRLTDRRPDHLQGPERIDRIIALHSKPPSASCAIAMLTAASSPRPALASTHRWRSCSTEPASPAASLTAPRGRRSARRLQGHGRP